MPSAAHCKLGPRRDGPVETTPVSGTETVPSAVLGISFTPSMQPWCLGDLLQRFQQAASSPDKTDVLSLRQARHRLSLYWLASPTDQLEFLYSKNLEISSVCVWSTWANLGQLLDDEQDWRDQLQALLQASVGSSAFLNYWLALMPYLQPGELRLDDPSAVIPPGCWTTTPASASQISGFASCFRCAAAEIKRRGSGCVRTRCWPALLCC